MYGQDPVVLKWDLDNGKVMKGKATVKLIELI